MKVRVNLTLDINADNWSVEFGIPKSEVRKDVASYLEYALPHLGILADLCDEVKVNQ